MKTIQTPLIITGIRAKVDGSLGISATTPELNKEEKVEVMELQNLNLEATFKPVDFKTKDIKEISGEFDSKSPSQRLRNTIFVYWEQRGSIGDFDIFYKRQMEKAIDKVKSLLDN
jgi:hypothetical protein